MRKKLAFTLVVNWIDPQTVNRSVGRSVSKKTSNFDYVNKILIEFYANDHPNTLTVNPVEYGTKDNTKDPFPIIIIIIQSIDS